MGLSPSGSTRDNESDCGPDALRALVVESNFLSPLSRRLVAGGVQFQNVAGMSSGNFDWPFAQCCGNETLHFPTEEMQVTNLGQIRSVLSLLRRPGDRKRGLVPPSPARMPPNFGILAFAESGIPSGGI